MTHKCDRMIKDVILSAGKKKKSRIIVNSRIFINVKVSFCVRGFLHCVLVTSQSEQMSSVLHV